MPYMPTNISPNNVTITKDEDIIFHCLIDKSDTITGVKLTLYNYYNREDKAYIELRSRESYDGGYIVNSSGLVLDEGNSSELPFVAAKYDIPVFAIGIFNDTSDFFKKNLKTIGYNLELTNKKDYSIFIMEGEIENFKTNEANVELQILASPLLNQSQIRLPNGSRSAAGS